MLLKDIEMAAILKSEAFQGDPAKVKRRFRALAKSKGLKPVHKYDDFWLWRESDLFDLCSPSAKGMSQARRFQVIQIRDYKGRYVHNQGGTGFD